MNMGMNQWFDNVREILAKHREHIPVKVLAEILAELDSEEAEVCEWKRGKTKVMILSPHSPQSAMWTEDVKMYPYCNCCGKRIKISEVE